MIEVKTDTTFDVTAAATTGASADRRPLLPPELVDVLLRAVNGDDSLTFDEIGRLLFALNIRATLVGEPLRGRKRRAAQTAEGKR
jgi:hypothetical protein